MKEEVSKENEIWLKLSAINVQENISNKQGKNYLSWVHAWDYIQKNYPAATYEVKHNEEGVPYTETSLGIMVNTEVTIEGISRKMWLPVMNDSFKAMKSEPYEYTTLNGTRQVAAATMHDVNRSIMRCLVKNFAMFGLGLNVYAGEDLPMTEAKPTETVAGWLSSRSAAACITWIEGQIGESISSELKGKIEAEEARLNKEREAESKQ